MKIKSMTLRLPSEQAEELELIAKVDGVPMSEEIREALAAHARNRLADPSFQTRLANNRERLNRLGQGGL